MKRINPFWRNTLANFCIGRWDIPYPQVGERAAVPPATPVPLTGRPDESKNAATRQPQSGRPRPKGQNLLTKRGDLQYLSAPQRCMEATSLPCGIRGRLRRWGG